MSTMQVYLAIKYHPDHQNRPAIEAISAIVQRLGGQVFCVTRDLEAWGEAVLPPAELMRRSLEAIDHSDLVLVELSEKGVGLGIEAGYARARQIPVVTLVRSGLPVSDTLRGISTAVLEYWDWTSLEQQLARLWRDFLA
jgi:2'-deoxynucleoside 5'-phosphate N-hydrolase